MMLLVTSQCRICDQQITGKSFSEALIFASTNPQCDFEHFFCTLLLLLKIIPTTFVKEVFILKHASLIQNLSKCSFPGCFPGVSRVIPGK